MQLDGTGPHLPGANDLTSPPQISPTLTVSDLAMILRRAETTLPRLLPRLRKHGFPAPILPGIWSRRAVLAWIDGDAVSAPPTSRLDSRKVGRRA